jgi:hypothetical protein
MLVGDEDAVQGSSPIASRRARICFRFNPASIRMRVAGLAMKMELPALEEASTQILTMAALLTLPW